MDNIVAEIKVFLPSAQNPKYSSVVTYSNMESHFINMDTAQEALFTCYHFLACARFPIEDIGSLKAPKLPNPVKDMIQAEIEEIVPCRFKPVKVVEHEVKNIVHFEKVPITKKSMNEVMVKFGKLKEDGWITCDIAYTAISLEDALKLIEAKLKG